MTKNISEAEREAIKRREEQIRESLADIAAPYWLDDELVYRFNELVEQMEGLGLLTILDANILAQYVYYENRFVELDHIIQEEGYTTSDGKLSQVVAEQRRTRELMAKMEIKLGLNPTDRLRFVKTETKEEIDELEEFRNEL